MTGRACSPAGAVHGDQPDHVRRSRLSDLPADGQGSALPDSAGFKIEIVYPDSPKPVWEELTKFDGKQFVYAGSGWLLTSDLDMKPDLGGKTAGFRRVAFRFTALSGTWRIDDLYVDPSRRI